MKNHTIIKVITGLLFLAVLLGSTTIITEVLLGYSGFTVINGKNSVITLQEDCQQTYTKARFGDALGNSLQVCFILALTAMLLASLALFIVVCVTYCRTRKGEEREETRIEELQSQYYERSNAVERYHPRMAEIVPLYLFLVLFMLATSLPLGFYFQLLVQTRNSTCRIDCNLSEIFAITLLTLGMLISALIAFALLLVLGYRQRMRAKMLQLQNGSESIGRQVDRIIREMPESQRRMYDEMRREEGEVIRKMGAKGRDGHSDSHRSDGMRVEEVPQVQSIIYKVEPELMLQSIEPKG